MFRKYLKKIGLVLLVAAGLLILLNFNFFWQNLKYAVSGPSSEPSQEQYLDIPRQEPNLLVIESLGIKAPVIYAESNTEEAFQEALQKGVVHYPGTVAPGEYGNVYIFGHSSDNVWAKGDYKTIFALLPRIEIGAEIILTDWNGNPLKYVVTQKFVADADDVHLLDQQNYEKRLLTLQTSYPIGTALRRYIVIAEIVEEKSDLVNPNPS